MNAPSSSFVREAQDDLNSKLLILRHAQRSSNIFKYSSRLIRNPLFSCKNMLIISKKVDRKEQCNIINVTSCDYVPLFQHSLSIIFLIRIITKSRRASVVSKISIKFDSFVYIYLSINYLFDRNYHF